MASVTQTIEVKLSEIDSFKQLVGGLQKLVAKWKAEGQAQVAIDLEALLKECFE